MLTGIRDVDREIVNKLDDTDLLNMCLVNRTYSERVCDESYFRLRTENGFSETIKYKDYTQITNKIRTWKNHYLSIVKYIDLLQTDFKYEYKSQDKSPELLYLARQLVAEDLSYNKNRALRTASERGHLSVVKYLVEHGADITAQDNEAVILASVYGHLSVVKYLVEHGADITARNNEALRWASRNGHLEIVKYLTEHGADIPAQDNYAVRFASGNGHLEVVKYLVEHGADISAYNCALRWASGNGRLEVVKYLRSLE